MKLDEYTHIRAFEEKDAAVLADIYNEHIAIGKSSMNRDHKEAKTILGWFHNFNDREGLWTIEKQSKAIGFGIIKRYSDRIGYRTTCETAVYLTDKETGEGYGSAMKRFLIDQCKRLSYHHLVAKILSVNPGSIIYNERLGYEIVGRQKQIGYLNGQWHDVIIMQLILDDVPAFLPEIS